MSKYNDRFKIVGGGAGLKPLCKRVFGAFEQKLGLKRFPKVLYMTLLVKNEADIIRENILFHWSLGVDGFIVTDNNSEDNTVAILEELKLQGIPIEIINETEKTYYQNVWVDRMIKIARDKYRADWVINSDADEFWYPVSLNLKQEIFRYSSFYNVLQVFLINFHPFENRDDFLCSSYFVRRNLQPFEQTLLGIPINSFNDACFCHKVIHATKDYKQIAMGNHNVLMKKNRMVYCPYIRLYHYTVRNYAHFERKVAAGGKAYENYQDIEKGKHWRRWYGYYKEGKLKEAYHKEFVMNKIRELLHYGVIARDNTVESYMRYAGIIK